MNREEILNQVEVFFKNKVDFKVIEKTVAIHDNVNEPTPNVVLFLALKAMAGNTFNSLTEGNELKYSILATLTAAARFKVAEPNLVFPLYPSFTDGLMAMLSRKLDKLKKDVTFLDLNHLKESEHGLKHLYYNVRKNNVDQQTDKSDVEYINDILDQLCSVIIYGMLLDGYVDMFGYLGVRRRVENPQQRMCQHHRIDLECHMKYLDYLTNVTTLNRYGRKFDFSAVL